MTSAVQSGGSGEGIPRLEHQGFQAESAGTTRTAVSAFPVTVTAFGLEWAVKTVSLDHCGVGRLWRVRICLEIGVADLELVS